MMPVILALAQLLIVLMMLVSAVLGWLAPEGYLVAHMYWGIFLAFFALLAHTITLFFFIGTSKAIRLECLNHPIAQPFVDESNRFKRLLASRTQLATLMFIVEPVLGAAVYSARISHWWHLVGFWLTLAVQLWVGYTEVRLLGLNNVLMSRVSEWKESGGLLPVDARLS